MYLRFFPGLLLSAFLFIAYSVSGQKEKSDSLLVQFSGMVLDGSTKQLYPIPYTNISVNDNGRIRGTYSDLKGFFSIVVKKGDVITFSCIGYQDVSFNIPTDLEDNRYSMVQLMSPDIINLPETVVFPWPSREHFKLEFLAMDVTPELQRRAAENLANETLQRLRKETPRDGGENATYYLQRQTNNYYHIGQQPPMNIFNPVAWKKFFDAWKRGDYKKKE